MAIAWLPIYTHLSKAVCRGEGANIFVQGEGQMGAATWGASLGGGRVGVRLGAGGRRGDGQGQEPCACKAQHAWPGPQA